MFFWKQQNLKYRYRVIITEKIIQVMMALVGPVGVIGALVGRGCSPGHVLDTGVAAGTILAKDDNVSYLLLSY